MSVLIKDMEMPESCFECRLFNDPWCMAKTEINGEQLIIDLQKEKGKMTALLSLFHCMGI